MRTFNEDMNIYVTIIEILKKFQIKENFFYLLVMKKIMDMNMKI